MRLDSFIAQHFDLSRQKAQDLIKAGLVLCDGEVVSKASFEVRESAHLELLSRPKFVSRAGEKLSGFLGDYDLEGRVALDVGSSTGGFAQVLLERGAKEVHCVDVGSHQLDRILREDSRVRVFEQCDIREFAGCEGSYPQYDFLSCDVSFISVRNIFEVLAGLSKEMVLLIKPQFEVGRGVKRDKKGVVQDGGAILEALENLEGYFATQGYALLKKEKSILKGRAGNEEYFMHLRYRD